MTPQTQDTTTEQATPKTLQDVQVGDTIVRVGGSIGAKPRLVKVRMVTPTLIGTDGTRFYKKNGNSVGSSTGYHHPSIRLPREGEIETLTAKAAEETARYAATEQAKREAMRGRTSGFLQAAREALEAHRDELRAAFPAPQGVEVDRNPALTLPSLLLSQVWSVASELEYAERHVQQTANSLRGIADRMIQSVERDADYESGISHQVMFEAATHEVKRVAAVKQAQELIRLVAAHLGVETEALVAPYAKVENAAVAS